MLAKSGDPFDRKDWIFEIKYDGYRLLCEKDGEDVILHSRNGNDLSATFPEITQAVKNKLDIEVGETTDDDKFTLVELECIGACGGAPAILMGETLHESITPEQVVEIIDQVDKDIDAGKFDHH